MNRLIKNKTLKSPITLNFRILMIHQSNDPQIFSIIIIKIISLIKYLLYSNFKLRFFYLLITIILINSYSNLGFSQNTNSLSPQTELIVLKIGSQQILNIPRHLPIHVEKRNIVKVKDLNHQVLLIGTHLGSTHLYIGNQAIKIIVSDDENYLSFQQLSQFLEYAPQLYLEYHDSGVYQIKGSLQDPSLWLTLSQLQLKNFEIGFRVQSNYLKLIELSLNETLKKNGINPVHLENDPYPSVRLPPTQTKLPSIQERQQDIIKSFGIRIKTEHHQLLIEPLVRVQVLLVEVRKSYSESLGLEWPNEVSLQNSQSPRASAISIDGPTVLARFLAKNGQGRILASPILLTKSGSEADFFAGGEIPIKSKTKQSHTITWKKYGISLKIKPLADLEGKISLDLSSEISSLDSGEMLEGIPALFSNSFSSHFDLQHSQTVALTGMVKKINGEAQKFWPGLGDLPLIGDLFKSKDYLEDQTELVVFVTPTIVSQNL